MGLRDRLIDPRSPDRRPRRAAYALPTLFTAGNIFLGFLSILRSFHGAMLAAAGGAGAPEHFAIAAKAIGAAVVPGRPGRPHRAHDQHHQRFRPRNGFARRRHQLRHRARRAGLRLGRAVHRHLHRRGHPRAAHHEPAISSRFSFCCAAPPGWRASTFRRTPSPRIPAARTASTSSACPFPPPPAWWRAVVFAFDGEPLVWWPLSVAWLALLAAAGLSHGQHLALLQLQRHQPQQAVYSAASRRGGRRIYRHLELAAARAAGLGLRLCRAAASSSASAASSPPFARPRLRRAAR